MLDYIFQNVIYNLYASIFDQIINRVAKSHPMPVSTANLRYVIFN